MSIHSSTLATAARAPLSWLLPAIMVLLLLLVWALDVNEALFFQLNQSAQVLPDRFWAILTTLGDAHILLALPLALAFRFPGLVWVLFASALIAFFGIHGVKELAGVMRPAGELPLESFNLIGTELRARAFPSGHTGSVFLVTTVLFLATSSRSLRTVLLGYALLIGFSRIAVGAHWPADVLAGAAVGWTAALLGALYAGRFSGGERPRWQTLQAIVFALALVTLPGADLGYDTTGLQIAIALLILAALVVNLWQFKPWRDFVPERGSGSGANRSG